MPVLSGWYARPGVRPGRFVLIQEVTSIVSQESTTLPVEELDQKAKKSLLRTLPYGLYACSCAAGDDVNVFAASWVSQCSFEPPLLMIAVRRDSYSHELIRRGGVFALNLIRKSDQQVVVRFFKTVRRDGNKLGDVPFHVGKTGSPVLDIALGVLECEVVHLHEAGDHSVVIGKIVSAERFCEETPLICSDTTFHYSG